MRNEPAVGVDTFFDVRQVAIDDPVQTLGAPTRTPDLLRASASVTSSHDDWFRGLP